MFNGYDIYRDIKNRTNGTFYIGVVGPVRTGKSTFIKRFMDLLVIPNIAGESEKEQAVDELPQSGNGKMIMTTEPKFIPKVPVVIEPEDGTNFAVRLIDCVGYMVEGALGHMEEENDRMVKTPWQEDAIPFTKAAEIGTKKVITEHSTIGIVVTADGSFGELPRESFIKAEEKTVDDIKSTGKPFIILLNSNRPYSKEAKELADSLSKKYGASVFAANCLQLKNDDILRMLDIMLSSFPVTSVKFSLPKWVEILQNDNPIKKELFAVVLDKLKSIKEMRDVNEKTFEITSDYVKKSGIDRIHRETGIIEGFIDVEEKFYYDRISRMLGADIVDEYEFMRVLKDIAASKKEYESIGEALHMLKETGYAVLEPDSAEISLSEPEIIKHGAKYGVKLKAVAPSIHFIKADIEIEIAPIVGTETQAKDLVDYMQEQSKSADNGEGILSTNIFGKTVKQLIADGINSKISNIGDDSRQKLQGAMHRIINESNGNLICIII